MSLQTLTAEARSAPRISKATSAKRSLFPLVTNWRQTVWYPNERVVYGVHGNSGYLFRFDPRVPSVEVAERITSLPSKKSRMNSIAVVTDGTVYTLSRITERGRARTDLISIQGPFTSR